MFPGINCDPDVYVVTATVTADSANVVDEASETNNSTSRTFGPPRSRDGLRLNWRRDMSRRNRSGSSSWRSRILAKLP